MLLEMKVPNPESLLKETIISGRFMIMLKDQEITSETDKLP